MTLHHRSGVGYGEVALSPGSSKGNWSRDGIRDQMLRFSSLSLKPLAERQGVFMPLIITLTWEMTVFTPSAPAIHHYSSSFPAVAGKQQTTPTKGRWMLSQISRWGLREAEQSGRSGKGQSRNSKGISRVPGCRGLWMQAGNMARLRGRWKGQGKAFPTHPGQKKIWKSWERKAPVTGRANPNRSLNTLTVNSLCSSPGTWWMFIYKEFKEGRGLLLISFMLLLWTSQMKNMVVV